MISFEQWIDLMKVLGDPYGAIHEVWFKEVREGVMEYAAAHAPRLAGGVVHEWRGDNGDYTIWLSPELPSAT